MPARGCAPCWPLALAALSGLWVAAIATVEVNKPFQVVRPTANHTSMLPVMDGLSRLAQHDESISIVSVVGPYHSGKSFLLNSLVGDTKVFSIGRRTSPETMGIWLCRTEMKAADGSQVWLMDSEGFFGPGISEGYDAKIFTIASLLGGHLVYNTVKIIDQQAVNLLEMLARRAQLFRTRSSAEAVSAETPEFLSVRSFPPLTWVVEDFVQELPEEHRRDEDGATAWLRSYLAKVNETELAQGEDTHFLSRLYSELKVHTLFLPATTKEGLRDLSTLSWDELNADFKTELKGLRSHILDRLQARKFEGRAMTGPTLERALRFIVQALQRGMFHELPSLWATWTAQVAEMSLQDADSWFASLLSSVDHGDDPIPVSRFNSEVEAAREKAVEFYKELLHDFDVLPKTDKLQSRMGAHFQHKLTVYHERIQRWVGELILGSKDQVSKFLQSIEIPVDPDVLRRNSDNVTKISANQLEARLRQFAMGGAPVKLGKKAQMPVFAQDPNLQLHNDLRTLAGMRELENEKEIVIFFKSAVAAADEAVDTEIKMNGNKLLGKARLKELRDLVSVKCWQAFNERLAKHKWMMFLTHYKTHEAQVQTETVESRMARFEAANEQRLGAHFRTVLDRCVSSYKARKANLAMPVSETDIDGEHHKLASAIREMLEEQGRDLSDTDSFKGSLRRLNAEIEEGHRHVRQKNVELWKVHSDEATRCALRENQRVERSCSFTCLFNKVPTVHKSTSKKHLIQCFARSGAASKMSPQMQLDVFENWYNKDLAHDGAMVWNNFYIGSAIIGIVVMAVCRSRGRQPAPFDPSVPGMHPSFQPYRTGGL